MRPGESPNTVAASSKDIPCLVRLLAVRESHSNLIIALSSDASDSRLFQRVIGYGDDTAAGLQQHGGRRATEILVELELHAGLVTGTSTYRSRLISEP